VYCFENFLFHFKLSGNHALSRQAQRTSTLFSFTYDFMTRLGKTEIQHSQLWNDFYRFNFQEAESPCKFFNFTSTEFIFSSVSMSGVSPSGILTTVSEETLKKTHLPAKRNAIEKAFHLIEAKLVDAHGGIPQLCKQNNVNSLRFDTTVITSNLGLPD
jgi:hypothetical protein